MEAKTVAILFEKAMPERDIERIFVHDGKYIVEAYPKGEPKGERAYCAYYALDPKTKDFGPYTPMNVSIKETDRFFESAKNKLPFK